MYPPHPEQLEEMQTIIVKGVDFNWTQISTYCMMSASVHGYRHDPQLQ